MIAQSTRLYTTVSRTTITAALCLALAGTLGAVVPLSSYSVPFTAILLGLASLPLLILLVDKRPALALGTFVAVQPLEAFEVRTPIGTGSVGLLVLVLLLVRHGDKFLSKLKTERPLRLVAALLLLWMVAYPLRIGHEDAAAVARQMITMASFLAIAVVGASLSAERDILGAVAKGAVVALVTLGMAGVLVSYGIIPEPDRISEPRSVLGINSPFSRNYGLNVPFDAVAVLFPLCVPYFAVKLMRPNMAVGARCSSVVALASVLLPALLIFQSRGMVIQVMLALAVSAIIIRPRLAPFVGALGMAAVVALSGELVETDIISSGLRTASYSKVIENVVWSPSDFVFGVDENEFYTRTAASIGAGQAVSNDNAVHNLFLSNLVAGGYVSFLLLASAYWLLLLHTLRLWRARPKVFEQQVLLVAVVLALFAISVEPVRAGVVGSWLVMGLALGGQSPASSYAGRNRRGALPPRGEEDSG